MLAQTSSPFSYLFTSNQASSGAQAAASSGVNNSTEKKATFAQLMERTTQAKSATQEQKSATATFDTSQGVKELNIDDYFSPPSKSEKVDLASLPHLLPNRQNIEALQNHISAKFPEFLAKNNIPSAPSSMTYDGAGKIQLPSDYPYASELKAALEKDPTMARELSTVNALSSHLSGIQRSMAFRQEYASADTQEAINAVIAKYQDLFSGNKTYDIIALHFTKEGKLSVTVNGKPISQTGSQAASSQ